MKTMPLHGQIAITLVGVLVLATGFPRPAPATPNADPPPPASRSEAADFARHLGIGWNLGNALDATGKWIRGTTVRDYETAWGNPVTTKAMIDGIRASGFRSIRIPVAWSNGMGPNHTIDPPWMARVEEVVNYALEDDMYVILDLHWDGGWVHKFSTDYEETMGRYRSVWTQIADRFKNDSNHLVFESLNEEGSFGDLWNPRGGLPDQKDKAYEVLNAVNQAFTDLVRASGGNNAGRYLLIAGYGTNIGRTVDPAFRMPRDPAAHSMVSVHYYSPPGFAILERDASWGKAADTWGTPAEVEAVAKDLLPLKARFLDRGIPVVVGEYGCPRKKDPASVVKYLSTVCQSACSLGCVPVLWDPGGFYDRRTLRWNDPRLPEALARVAATPPP